MPRFFSDAYLNEYSFVCNIYRYNGRKQKYKLENIWCLTNKVHVVSELHVGVFTNTCKNIFQY